MIIYSRQNPIDLCPTVWSFDSSLNKFYNWKNTPIQGITKIPNKQVKLQIYLYDLAAPLIELAVRVINIETETEISGIAYIIEVPSTYDGVFYQCVIDLSLIPANTKFYIEVDGTYLPEDYTETLRSSCYILSVQDDEKLIKIQFGNTVNNRMINGILFDENALFNWYLYANKYDTEIEIVEDETASDFKGNKVLVDKTHDEIDVFEIVDMPKKKFMGLIAISENDVIYVNGRRANFSFDKVTESRVGIYEICFINAFMRVTYADDDGLLDVRNVPPENLMLIDSENYLNIDSNNKLKNR